MKTILRLCDKVLTACTFILTLMLYLFAVFLYPEPKEDYLDKQRRKSS